MDSKLREYIVYALLLGPVVPAHAFADADLGRSLSPDRYGLYLDHINVGEEIYERGLNSDPDQWLYVGTWRALRTTHGVFDLHLYHPHLGTASFDRNPRIIISETYHERVTTHRILDGETVPWSFEIKLSERQYDCLDPSVVRYYSSVEIDDSIVTKKFDFTKSDARFYRDSYVPGMTGFSKETETWLIQDSEHQALWEIVCDLNNYDVRPGPSRRIR